MMRLATTISVFVYMLNALFAVAQGEPSEPRLATIQEVIDARTDIWGDAARRQPNGASYEFFKDLLPPLRWVNTDFHHYPLVLSAPRSPMKARFVSNGSTINARANKPPMWYEVGVPVTFFVGKSPEQFGAYLSQLNGPKYQDGYLPVVKLEYRTQGATYREEVFAPVDPQLAEYGTALVRFTTAGGPGIIAAHIDSDTPLRVQNGNVLNAAGRSVIAFTGNWKWDANRNNLSAAIQPGESAELAVFTEPTDPGEAVSKAVFDQRKEECVKLWRDMISKTTRIVTPEPLVNDAWRSTLIGTQMIAVNDRLHYSANNAYAKLYEGECGDTLRSLMLFGQIDDAAAMLVPLLKFDREATRFHVAGHKLQLLAYFYWLTRDADAIRTTEPLWRPSIELILGSREKESGLLPKDNYAGDINEKVYSLNSNANCWRGLRDVAAMLDEMGDQAEAERLRRQAADYREVILSAVGKSERRDTKPPFIPVALLSNEPAHDPLTATRQGSYYNLMCPYIIGSEIFGQGSERENWLLGYLENHGAIAMGMIRTTPHQGQFDGEAGVNPLYGLRYQLALLRRDEREKALVGFYGQLAQGMTCDTFIGGEGSRFLHGDADGRSFYLPPNSTSNAAWMITLRSLMVQDWDLDEDGKPDTLRLLYAVPRRWFEDGKRVELENAPTQFGRLSCQAESNLSEGFVRIRLIPPPRTPESMSVRAPLPDGWQVTSADIDGQSAPVTDRNLVDLTGRTAPFVVTFKVSRID